MPETINLFGSEFPIYYLFWFLGFPTVVLFNAFFYRKRYRMGNMKNVFVTMLAINGVYSVLMLFSWYFQKMSLHGVNFVRIVGFLPLVYVLTAVFSRSSINKTLDFCSPGTSLCNTIAHIGCIFPGCCHGFAISSYPSWLSWTGIYCNETGTYTFPIQLVECFFYGLIAVIILIWAKRKNYHTEGKAYPIYLILFGVARFCLEFLRDNEKIAGPLSEFAFWCIGWVVEGIVWLVILYFVKKKRLDTERKAAEATAQNPV